jgi:hypothetical protein
MKNQNIYKQAKIHLRLTKTLNLSVFRKGLIVLFIVGMVLYTVLFTTYPPVHDFFHELRHSLMAIPCH